MGPLAGVGEKVVGFRPHRVFHLTRVLGSQNVRRVNRLVRDIRGFMAVHGEHHVIERSPSRLATHVTHGDVVAIYTEEGRARRLVGVSLCVQTNEESPVLELAYTAIDRQFRGQRMAQLAACGAMISKLHSLDDITGIALACRPDNWLCRSAADELGVDFWTAAELMEHTPPLRSLILRHRVEYLKRDWRADPLVGLVRPAAVADAARLVQDAAGPRGLAWTRNSRVMLDGEWNLTGSNNAESRLHLARMAEGHLPSAALWNAPPPSPSPQIDRCA